MGIIAEQWLIDECVHLSVQRATGLRKVTGQLGREELGAATALRLCNCRSVHGFGMAIDLDVAFVGKDGVITSVRRLTPWGLAADRFAVDTFELRAGELAQLGATAGSRLTQLTKGEQ